MGGRGLFPNNILHQIFMGFALLSKTVSLDEGFDEKKNSKKEEMEEEGREEGGSESWGIFGKIN